jgi:nucleoside 2-deoxyribosyltransferase
MRVLLRRAKYVVADLTYDDNYGAYWESGFAEGLGKPVIYACQAKQWEIRKSHFDTNHLTTVIWEASDPKAAEERLLDTIRATLPDIARMGD